MDDDPRATEVEILRSMYTEDELTFPDPTDDFNFEIILDLGGRHPVRSAVQPADWLPCSCAGALGALRPNQP
jgi:hypothetical protein